MNPLNTTLRKVFQNKKNSLNSSERSEYKTFETAPQMLMRLTFSPVATLSRVLLYLNMNTWNIPTTLWKYMSLGQYLESMIDNNTLWFSSPKDFNDPYDCNFECARKQFTIDEIRAFWNKQKKNEEIPNHTAKEIIQQWANNPNDFYEAIYGSFLNAIQDCGVCCFSSEFNHPLMWAHYTRNHFGVCIGFDTQKLLSNFEMVSKVKYDDEFPKINILDDLNIAAKQLVNAKSSHWSYENEIRILGPQRGTYPFNKNAMSEVIFGLRTTEEDMIALMDRIYLKGYRPTFKKMRMMKDKYQLVYDTLTPKTYQIKK
jgi:hypothetical protein